MIKETNTKLILVPVLFASFLKENQTKGPAEIPSKRLFTFKDITRIGLKQNISIKGPPIHPFNPLLPLRVVSAIEDEKMKLAVTQMFFNACWRDGIDISDERKVEFLLKEIHINPKIIFENLNEAKQKLIQQSEKAIKDGIFGVPSFKVDDEIFWGQDRIEFVKEFIEGKDHFYQQNIEK
eukprot:gene10164-2584_t